MGIINVHYFVVTVIRVPLSEEQGNSVPIHLHSTATPSMYDRYRREKGRVKVT